MPSESEAEELRGVIARSNEEINTARAQISKVNVQIATCRDNLKQISDDAEAKRARLSELRASDIIPLCEFRAVTSIISGSEDMISTIQSDLAMLLVTVQQHEATIRDNEAFRRMAQEELDAKARIIPFPVRP